MSNLKIPNFNYNSKKYLFKNKLNLRKKSKAKLLKEAILMIISSLLIFFINFVIPEKKELFNSFFINLNLIYIKFLETLFYFYKIFIVLFMISSTLISTVLIIGGILRVFKLIKKRTKSINYWNSLNRLH